MIRVLATSRGVVLPALQNRVTTVVTWHQSANNWPTDLQQCHQQWIRTQRLKSCPEVRPLFLASQSLSKIKVESFNFPTSSPTQTPCSAVVSLPCFSATNFLNLTNTCGQKPCFRATSLQPTLAAQVPLIEWELDEGEGNFAHHLKRETCCPTFFNRETLRFQDCYVHSPVPPVAVPFSGQSAMVP